MKKIWGSQGGEGVEYGRERKEKGGRREKGIGRKWRGGDGGGVKNEREYT